LEIKKHVRICYDNVYYIIGKIKVENNLDISSDEMYWRLRIFDSLSYPSVIISADITLISANKKFYKAFNLSFKEIYKKKCSDIFSFKNTPCNSEQCTICRVIEDKKSYSFTIKHRYRWEERVFSPIFDDNGDVVYIMASIRDITRTKSLENQLHGIKEFMSRVVYSSASAIIAADMQGNINLMNPVAKELFGDYNGGEGKIKHTTQLYPPGQAKEIMRMLRDEKIGGKGRLLIPRTNILNYGGEKIEVQMSAAIIYDEKGNESATMAIYNDLRDRMKIEKELKLTRKQLVQSEKMASLGQLAAGVAHEINNPLTGVLFYANLLLENDNLNASMREDIGYILEDANRCKKIVKGLLVYSHSKGTEKNIVQINDVVEQSLTLLRDQKKFRNIKIKKNLSDEMMLINADNNKLNQVVINLVINAVDAIDGAGTITLTTYKDKTIKKVYLEVADTGKGIPIENLYKIFDPFFTTKEVGKSTGLGLSIVYGIIDEHEGRIVVKKTDSKGTTFIIEFPMYLASENAPSLCKP
jgi:two-component system, NtrC family, sensor kinase